MKHIPHQLIQFFSYSHLPEHLQAVSKPFHDLACHIDQHIPLNPEKTTSLRKLLESKDCAVRALVFKPGPEQPNVVINFTNLPEGTRL